MSGVAGMRPSHFSSSHSNAREVQSERQNESQEKLMTTPAERAPNQMQWGASAHSAPHTPARRMPVVDRSKADPGVVKAAEGMEAMFLDYLMQTMRQTVPKNEMDLESPATSIYRGMMDSEMAQRAAHQGGVGLADQIIAYLDSRGYAREAGSLAGRSRQSAPQQGEYSSKRSSVSPGQVKNEPNAN